MTPVVRLSAAPPVDTKEQLRKIEELRDEQLITEEEYLVAICEAVEAEKARYEESLGQHFGRVVTLA